MYFKFIGRGPHRLPDGRVLNHGDTFEDKLIDWSLKRSYIRVISQPSPTQAAPPSPPPVQGAPSPVPSPAPPPSPAPAPAPTPHAEEAEEVEETTWPLPDDLRELAFADALAFYRRATGKTARSWDVLIEEYRAWYTTQAPDEGGL